MRTNEEKTKRELISRIFIENRNKQALNWRFHELLTRTIEKEQTLCEKVFMLYWHQHQGYMNI